MQSASSGERKSDMYHYRSKTKEARKRMEGGRKSECKSKRSGTHAHERQLAGVWCEWVHSCRTS